MGTKSYAAVLAGLLTFGTSLAGCGRGGDVGTAERPLVLMLSPAHAPSEEAARSELTSALERETGLKVEVEVAATGIQAIVAFGAARADVGLLSPTEYLFAREEYGVRARLQVRRSHADARYAGEIVVLKDSAVRQVADLAGKKIAYADDLSTSGFLLPAALLEEAKVDVEAVFAGGHAAALAQLKAGEVEAAATYQGVAGADATLRVVASTGPIPYEPICLRKDLDAAVADKVVAGLLAMAKTPEGAKVWRQITDVEGFTEVGEGPYDELLERIRKAGVVVADLVKSGRTVSWANNPILGPEF